MPYMPHADGAFVISRPQELVKHGVLANVPFIIGTMPVLSLGEVTGFDISYRRRERRRHPVLAGEPQHNVRQLN